MVVSGELEIFYFEARDGIPVSPRKNVCRVDAEGFVFPISVGDVNMGQVFLAVPSLESSVLKIRYSELVDSDISGSNLKTLALAIDSWVEALSSGIASNQPVPKTYRKSKDTSDHELDPGESLGSAQGVRWASILEGKCYYCGDHRLRPAEPGDVLPLTTQAWIQADESSKVHTTTTYELLSEDGTIWNRLEKFHAIFGELARFQSMESDNLARSRFQNKLQHEQRLMETALDQLAMAGMSEPDLAKQTTGDPFLQAVKMVAKATGIDVPDHQAGINRTNKHERLLALSKASRFRIRAVSLKGNWWKTDHGPLLAFQEVGDTAVALLPTGLETYELVNPIDGRQLRVDASVASGLKPRAYMFYRAFPGRPLTIKDILEFGMYASWQDMRWIVAMGAGAGLLSTAIPIATGILWDTIIPNADKLMLFQMVLGIFVSSMAAAIFSLVQGFAQLRLTGRMSAGIQAAVWDRLLDLPASFYRRFSSGDLSSRAFGIESIHQIMSGSVLTSLLSGVFCIFNIGLLFHYGLELVPMALGIILVAAVFMWICLFLQLKYQRQTLEVSGKLQGMTLQFLLGIAKIRTCSAELRAFNRWAGKYSEQKTLSLKSRKIGVAQSIFNSSLPLVTSLLVFGFLGSSDDSQKTVMDTGKFLAFSAALTGVISSVLSTVGSLSQVLTIIPTYERTKPILDAVPEWSYGKTDPGDLNGHIEGAHLRFKYKPDGPEIIKNVSFEAQPGEFIALVGPSGSGKSTIFRLLIGFETPEYGSIYYDGQALSELDMQSLRRQIGVVLQDGKLLSGSIFDNIVGASGLGLEEAWDAARMAALDKDIEAMPMGMHTIIGEGGTGISGGQKQRLLIARALVRKPRILFFDEATSALDNEAQAAVSESLEGLQATRIVIAHRLSTIRNADRIYVLVNGILAESGKYDELVSLKGVFSDLVKRQLA